ncbi:MAG: hypothetical protein COB37_06865 [Kordiimonadales bacterium]|nr:MAG: hypothetical protein COB37_06865 [Kordiimonadales bacterium]
MKALIVDSEELYRLSLKEVVKVSANFTEVLEAGSEHEFLSCTATHTELALVILHPSSLKNEGEDWVRLVRRLYPGVAIITVTNTPHESTSRWLGTMTIARGASVNAMITTIRRAMRLPSEQGEHQMTPGRPNVTNSIQNEFSRFRNNLAANEEAVDLNRLSYRQKQILAMAADGLPNKEIAARLTIAEGTVKAHMHAIFKVLGVSNRTQAVIRYGAAGRQQQLPQETHTLPAGSNSQMAHMRY